MPGEPSRRREHERAVVAWIGGYTVYCINLYCGGLDRRGPGQALPYLCLQVQPPQKETPLQVVSLSHVSWIMCHVSLQVVWLCKVLVMCHGSCDKSHVTHMRHCVMYYM